MNRFIIADPKKCIGCHTCEVACVVSHQEQETGIETVVKDEFFPRIHVMKGYTISTAVVCRQCEDAPCANAARTALSAVKMILCMSIRPNVSAAKPV